MLLVVSTVIAAPGQATVATETSTTDTPTEMPTADPTPTPGEANGTNSSVVFYDQETQGDELVVAEVTLPNGGFVAVFEGSRNGTLLGNSAYLGAGAHENVDVPLSRALSNDTTFVAVLYRDADGNQSFDRTVDELYRANGSVVSAEAYVTSAPTPATTTPTVALTTSDGDATVTGTGAQAHGFGVIVAVTALLLGGALARKRA